MRTLRFTIEELEAWLSVKICSIERSYIFLTFLVMLYGIIFSNLSILRYYAFKAHAWDLGIFTQSLWTTLYANRFFYYTCELFVNPSGSFFGVHFSPILFLILPFYRAYTAPETLLVFQSFVIALAALPIYKLAKEHNRSRLAGLTFASAYLMYPAIQWVNWYDFHVQAFLPLFFTFAIYYATKENWIGYFVFLLFSLMCEEHVAFITFFIGLYIAWKYKRNIILAVKKKKVSKKVMVPLLTMVASVVWYWFTLWYRDSFFPINPIATSEFLGSANFTILGAKDPLEIPLMILLRPLNAIQALIYNGHVKLLFIFLTFGPLSFYSFRRISALIPTIPWFTFSLMSQATVHYLLGLHYPAYITAFIFIAAIFSLRNNSFNTRIKGIKKQLKRVIICSLIIFVIASPFSPFVYKLFPEIAVSIGEHERLLNDIILKLPQNASILTQNNIFPQVSHRLNAYVIPSIFLSTGVQDFALEFVNKIIDQVEYILIDSKTDPTATALVISLLETKPDFALIISEDNNTILLYQRKNSH